MDTHARGTGKMKADRQVEIEPFARKVTTDEVLQLLGDNADNADALARVTASLAAARVRKVQPLSWSWRKLTPEARTSIIETLKAHRPELFEESAPAHQAAAGPRRWWTKLVPTRAEKG